MCRTKREGRRAGGYPAASPCGRPSSAWLRNFPSSLRTCCCIQYRRDGFSRAAFRRAWSRWHARSAGYVVARSWADSSTKRIPSAAATLGSHVYGARLESANSAPRRGHAGRSNPAAFAQASRERVCYNFTTSGEACAVVVRDTYMPENNKPKWVIASIGRGIVRRAPDCAGRARTGAAGADCERYARGSDRVHHRQWQSRTNFADGRARGISHVRRGRGSYRRAIRAQRPADFDFGFGGRTRAAFASSRGLAGRADGSAKRSRRWAS